MAARTPLRALSSNSVQPSTPQSSKKEPSCDATRPIETIAIPNSTKRLELLAALGEGGFGTVYRGRDPVHGPVAVKECCDGGEETDREIDAHRALEAHHDASGGSGDGLFVRLFYHVTTATREMLVMELIQGIELEDVVANRRPLSRLPEDEARRIARQLLTAVAFLHEAGIAHLDIKPRNVLVDAAGRSRLIDYGSSARFTAGDGGEVSDQGDSLPLRNVAPERHEAEAGEGFNGPAADLFSVGCTIFYTLAGEDPFDMCTAAETDSIDALIDRIEAGDVPFDALEPPLEAGERARELVRGLLEFEPEDRPSATDAMHHAWFAEGESAIDELGALLAAGARVA